MFGGLCPTDGVVLVAFANSADMEFKANLACACKSACSLLFSYTSEPEI